MGRRATALTDRVRIRTVAGLLTLLFWVGPRQTLPSSPAAVGSVTGTVRLQPTPPDRKPMLSPYARPRYRPPVRADVPNGSPETVVVYLRAAGPPPEGDRAPAQITQRDRTILPHVTVVQVGTRVDFPNDDDVFHNIFSLSGPKRFNLGRYPPGESRSEVFARPGVVRLFCDIHSEMGGVILVVDTPYFTQPDADGRFRIANVPEGQYTAIVWHEAAGTDSLRVVVTPGGEARVDFTLGG
jgi:plastocyanin